MTILDFSRRCALGICLCAPLTLAPSAYALAQLVPGTRLCGLTDSAQTLAAERIDLNHRLPSGYRDFKIVSGHNNDLKVVVPETTAMVQKRVPVDKISDIWESVLGAHHRDCGYSNLSVEFVSPSGKELLLANTDR